MNRKIFIRVCLYLGFLAISAALFYAMFIYNTNSPRINVADLDESAISSHPVILEGGNYIKLENGRTEYKISFDYGSNAFLYFPRGQSISINGDMNATNEMYRGRVFELLPGDNSHYDVSIYFSDNNPSSISSLIYLGNYEQIASFINFSSMVNYYVQGFCFAVILLSDVLFLFKNSERYLIWLALLAFFRGSYYRLSDLLSPLSALPVFSILLTTSVYLIITELLAVFFQYKIMESFGPVKIGKIPFPFYALAAALPVIFLYNNTSDAVVCTIIFYAVLYVCYMVCFIRLPDTLSVERNLLMITLCLTTLLRMFDEFCELGVIPSGNLNIKIRLRGIISILFVLAFFVVAGKRFAQKFQEADDLNEHLEAVIRKKAQQQTVFVRGMLHNLKTPLFSLSGYSDMAISSINRNPAMAQSYMEKAREKAILAGDMMDRIFLVTQMDSDMVQMQSSPVNLSELLKAVCDTTTAGEEDKNLTLNLSLVPEVYVDGDSLYLRQAFQNLIDNARINTPDGGSIEIRVELKNEEVIIHVADTGCGIAPEEIQKVFEAYYSNRHGKQASSGLGLYITREIIRKHGGNISVSSQPGSGTDFQVCLPLPSEKI